jgi:hypothetical protein
VSTDHGLRWVRPLVGLSSLMATLAVLLGFAIQAGLPVGTTLRLLGVVLLCQLLPGVLIWRAVRPVEGWWPVDLALGFPIGTALAIGAQVAAGTFGLPWLSLGVGPAVSATLLALPWTRRRILAARTVPLPLWWVPLVCSACLVAVAQLVNYFGSVPLRWADGARVIEVDTYFHLALAGELAHRGPGAFPYVSTDELAYHWFSHAWVAQLSVASGAGLDQVLLRFMPALMPLAVAAVTAAAAVTLSRRPWTGPLAAVLAMAGGDLSPFGKGTPGYPIAPYSPSLGLAAPLLVAAVVVIGLRWRGQLRTGGVLLVPVLTFAAAGSKGSTVPLLVVGLALAAVAIAVLDRRRLPMVLLDLGLVCASLVLALILVFHGATTGLRFDPIAAITSTYTFALIGGPPTGTALAWSAGVAMLAVLSRGLPALGLLSTRAGLKDPLSWLLLGAGGAGAAAVVTLYQPGLSQVYFARSADPLLALGAALGILTLVDRLKLRLSWAVGIAVVAGPVLVLAPARLIGSPTGAVGLPKVLNFLALAGGTLAVAAVLALLVTRRQRLRVLTAALTLTLLMGGVTSLVVGVHRTPPGRSNPVTSDYPGAVTVDQVRAARWIRDHSAVDDLVMTNRHCQTPNTESCDPRRFALTAFSERQFLVEGWSYTPHSEQGSPEFGPGGIYVPYWRPDLLRLNDGFIDHPDQQSADRLRQLGVKWVLVDRIQAHAASTLEPWARLRYALPTADVYEFTAGR